MNDLRLSLKSSTASHFADDTSIIYQSKKLKTLESNLNHILNSAVSGLTLQVPNYDLTPQKIVLCSDPSDGPLESRKKGLLFFNSAIGS